MTIDTTFGSDNHSGVHPRVLEAIAAANCGPAVAYGADAHTEAAVAKFREHFGRNADVYLVFNGTGANVVSLSTLARSFQAVICSEHAHINADECGAPESATGCKLLTVHSADGKLTCDDIARHLQGRLDQHRVQPAVVSITQASELGTVYASDEVKAIAAFCHHHGLYLHMDGARIAQRRRQPGPGAGRDHGRPGRGHPFLRRHQERPAAGRSGGVLPPRAEQEHPLRPQAVHAAGQQDALHRRPADRAAQRRPLAEERRPRQPHGQASAKARSRISRACASRSRSRPTPCSPPCPARPSTSC